MTKIGTDADADLYVANILHRSFGAVKSMTMGTTAPTSVNMTYDDALRPFTYEAENSTTGANVFVQKASYTYLADGALKEINNQRDDTHSFDQKNEYDFAGRLKKNDVGPLTGSGSHPFTQTMDYDAFNNLTGRNNTIWGNPNGFTDSFTASYVNNRSTHYMTYHDNAGNVVQSTSPSADLPGGGGRPYNDVKHWTFDAAGRMAHWDEKGPWDNAWESHTYNEDYGYDGDGRVAKKVYSDNVNWGSDITLYYIHSSVTGQKITDIYSDGTFWQTHVYMGGSKIAANDGTAVSFEATDPLSGSTQDMAADGTAYNLEGSRNELAGLGTSVPFIAPQNYPAPPHHGGWGGDAAYGCKIIVDNFEWSSRPCTMSDLAGLDGYTWTAGKTIHVWGRVVRPSKKEPGFPVTIGTFDLTITVGSSAGMTPALYPLLRQTVPTSLEPVKALAATNALQEVVYRLKNPTTLGKHCKEKVLDRLARIPGFTLGAFISFLEKGGHFYDGKTSSVPQSTYQPNGGYPSSFTVADRFKRHAGLQAETSSNSGLPFTIFFRPSAIDTGEHTSKVSGATLVGIGNGNLAFLFHEGAHGYGTSLGSNDYGDQELYKAFGTVDKKGRITELPHVDGSIAISRYIQEHCFS